MRPRFFFDKKKFGVEKLVGNPIARGSSESEEAAVATQKLLKQFIEEAPIADQAKLDLPRLFAESRDFFPGLSSDEKKMKLARTSYANYLKDVAGVHADVVKLFREMPNALSGVGFEAGSGRD